MGVCAGTPRSCNDGNTCTTDICNATTGACEHINNSLTCTDNNVCTLYDVCNNGICQPGTTPLVCNDNNPCTDDTCDPILGCKFTAKAGGSGCNDNNVCTINDVCVNGNCTGTQISCPDDGNACTTASCNPLTGCFQVNNTATCDDGNPCTVNDRCTNGICTGTPKSCDDGNPCTTDICNATTGACEHINNSLTCTDNNVCTLNDVCNNGICQPGTTPLVCNDNNPCTDDTCDPILGCKFTPKAGGSGCNDNNVCTINDVCVNGNCTGTQISCPDDGNACTTASCNPLTGCFQVNNTATCDDGNPCTVNDRCTNGICAGTPKSCDDGNPCTTDICNATTGACEHINNSLTCTDNNVCTLNDVCNNGICQPGTTPLVCNDNNPCTDDTCDPILGCKFTAKAGGSGCNDNNVCTINDVCVNGNCTGTQISCPDDGNTCTTASCNPLTGCFQVNNTATCDDGNPCTVNDICTNGICAGTPKSCDDGNPCTTDICNATTGACEHINNTNSCNDGSACTSNDACSDGICVGTPIVCNDNNICTNDECNPAIGCTFTPITSSLQISGLNYFQNTITGNVTKGALNNLFTNVNTLPPTDPSYILTKIGVGANVGFFAGNSVILNPGFQVASGSVFKAEIKTCN